MSSVIGIRPRIISVGATMADPDLAEAYFNMALAMDQSGKPHDAKAAFKKAVELAPDGPRMKEASILKQYISK